MADEQSISDEESVPVYRNPWEGFSPDVPYKQIEPLLGEQGIQVGEKATQKDGPISTDAYKQKVSDLLEPDSFWELPYEEKVKQVRSVYLGDDLAGKKTFEDEQEVTDLHKQILADIRDYDGKQFNLPEILSQVPEPPSQLKDAIRNKDFDTIDKELDAWEATTLATLKTGGLRWKEIEDIAEPQLADYVDKTKNELKAIQTYGEDPNRLEWFASNISQIIRSGGETLAGLVPGEFGKKLQRKAKTATETIDLPFVGSLPMLPPASATGEGAPTLNIGGEIEINSETLASSIGSGAAFMGLGVAGGAVAGAPGAFAALIPTAARLGYAETYDKIYRETGDANKATEGGVYGALSESVDALVHAFTLTGAFRPLTKLISKSTKLKAVSEAIKRGGLGRGFQTGFKEVTQALPTVGIEAGTEAAQTYVQGEIIAAYTGNEKNKATRGQIATAALAGGIMGVGGAGANVSTDIVNKGTVEANNIASQTPQPDITKEVEIIKELNQSRSSIPTAESTINVEKSPTIFTGVTEPLQTTPLQEEGSLGVSQESALPNPLITELSTATTPIQENQQDSQLTTLETQDGSTPEENELGLKTLESITSTGIIHPSPMENDGENILGPNQIVKLAEKKFNKIVRRGRFSKTGLGNYYPGFGVARMKFKGDISTAVHELAHSRDDILGLGDVTELNKLPQAAQIKIELNQLAPGGSGSSRRSLQYNMGEGVAEYIRSWIVNPQLTETSFPEFTKYFKQKVPQQTQKDFQDLGIEIRKYYGAPALKQIGSNVRFHFDAPTLLEKIANEAQTTGDVYRKTALDRIKNLTISDRNFLWKAIQTAKDVRGHSPLPSKDPAILYTLLIGETGRIATILERGEIDSQGNQILPPFRELYSGLDTSSYKNLEKEMKLVVNLMIAERAVEKEVIRQAGVGKSLKKQGPITGIAGTSNISSKGRTEMDVAAQAFNELENLPIEQQQRIRDATNRFRDYADRSLRRLVDAGILSVEDYNTIKSQNNYYVTMQRVFEDEDSSVTKGLGRETGGKPIKALKGSGREIINPYIGLMEAFSRVIRAVDKNIANRAFVDLLNLDRDMYQGSPGAESTLGEIGYRVPQEEAGTLKVFRNGKPEFWKLDPDVKEAIDGFSGLVYSPLVNVLAAPGDLLRWGVNNSPLFATRNYQKDFQDRLILSDTSTLEQAKNFLKGSAELGVNIAKTAFGKSNYKFDLDTQMFRQNGGDQSGHYARNRIDYSRAMRTAMEELSKDPQTILFIPGQAWGRYKNAIQLSEQSGREAEYRTQLDKAKKELGYSEEEAALYAADKAIWIMNFAEAGKMMRVINRIIPYTNPRIQGARKKVNVIGKNPKKFIARSMIFGALPILLMRSFNEGQDADDEYEQLPWYRRDMFFNFKIGNDKWLTIPKGFSEMAASGLIDRAYSASKGRQIDYGSITNLLISQAFPFDTQALLPVFRPTAEVILNKDLFREKTIVDEEYKPLNKREETKEASGFGIAIQYLAEKAGLSNNSIAKRYLNAKAIDHQMRGYLGNIGGLVLQSSNYWKKKNARPMTWGSVFGLGAGGVLYGSQDLEFIFNFMRENSVPSNVKTMRNLRGAIDSYYEATTPKDKDIKLKTIYKETARIRSGIEKHGRLFLVPHPKRKIHK